MMEHQISTASSTEPAPIKLDPIDIELLTKYYEEWTGPGTTTSIKVPEPKETALRIPLFYEKPPPDADDDDSASATTSNTLRQKLREEARSLFLQKKSRELLDNTELKELWGYLDMHHTPPVVDEEKMINFKQVKATIATKRHSFYMFPF